MDIADQVRASVDIVQVIGEHVRLKKLGATGRYVGLCPFHQEKTPSFSVHATKQFYYCFGCQAGGDVFRFLQEIERITFFEALKLLAERHGIPMPKRAEATDPESKLRGALFEMNELAASLFRQNLLSPEGSPARAYLLKRNVTAEQAEEFGLGLSMDSWDQLTRTLHKVGFTADHLEQSGLLMRRQEGGGLYDRFRGRLMFPIQNEAGKVIGFGGRALKPGDEPKYLNSPETAVYRKSYVLYNLNRAKEAIRKAEAVILVEGYMDVIGVYSSGVRQVVASCGTALTNLQVRGLKKHTDKIVVNFDPDAAGSNAAERSIQMLLEEGMKVRVLELEGGLDPDEYVKQNGAEAYERKLNQASSYFHWLGDRARRKFDMKSPEGKIGALQFLLPSIQRVSDKLERATIAEEVASYLGIDRGMVLEEFRRIAANKGGTMAKRADPGLPGVERLLLTALLASGEARAAVLPKVLELRSFPKMKTRGILEAVAAVGKSGGALQFAELEARLNDRDRELMASVLFADEVGEDETALEQAFGCLRSLEAQDAEENRAAIKDLIRSAERAGNFPEAMRLTEELSRLSLKRNR